MFIKLHTADRGEALVNLDAVATITPTISGQSEVAFVGGARLSVREMYEGLVLLLTGGSEDDE